MEENVSGCFFSEHSVHLYSASTNGPVFFQSLTKSDQPG